LLAFTFWAVTNLPYSAGQQRAFTNLSIMLFPNKLQNSLTWSRPCNCKLLALSLPTRNSKWSSSLSQIVNISNILLHTWWEWHLQAAVLKQLFEQMPLLWCQFQAIGEAHLCWGKSFSSCCQLQIEVHIFQLDFECWKQLLQSVVEVF